MRKAIIMTLLALTLNTTGCWDYHDINGASIPIIGAFDLNEENPGAKYLMSTIEPNLYPETKGQVVLTSLQSPTVGHFRAKHGYKTPELYNPGLLQSYLFGEDFARSGDFSKLADAVVTRSAQTSGTAKLGVVEGKAVEVLKLRPEDFPNIGIYIIFQLVNSQNDTFAPTVTLHSFFRNTGTGRNPVLPIIKAEGDVTVVTGIAIFKKFQMLEKLGLNETDTLAFLRGIKGMGNLNYKLKVDGDVLDEGSVMVSNSRKVRVSRNGDQFIFDIGIQMQGILTDSFSDKLFTRDPGMLQLIEKQLASDVRRDCNRFIDKMQNVYGFDCIDINRYALAKWRRELENTIDNEEFIKNAKINVKVKVNIAHIGEAN